ncbi:MAG: AarF/UbiB family protein [Bdellovibrionota bacterium]
MFRKLRHAPYRLFLMVTTLVPIYAQYLWMWGSEKYLRRRIPRERWNEVHLANAEKFFLMAVKLKGALIKVGQLISARVDIMPRAWTKTLSKLQDQVIPSPWHMIDKHLTKEYGRPPDEVFEKIDHEAVAAASFGQVHKALTKEGDTVALKIRYPDIKLKLDIDMMFFRVATTLFNIFVPKIGLKTIYQEISKALRTELNYRQEADYTRIIGKNMQGFPQLIIPRVLDKYTTDSVICTEYFEGFKITNFEKMESLGIKRRDVLEIVLNAWTKMIYEDGVFQSDPHPGNLFFRLKDGKPEVCVVDFGQCKIMPKEFHEKLMQAVFGFMSRDVDKFLPTIVNLGVMKTEDTIHARPILKDFFEKYFELSPSQARSLDFDKIRDDVQQAVSKINGIYIPNDIILYGRTFSLLSGLATQIDKTANMFMLAKPFMVATIKSLQAKKGQPAVVPLPQVPQASAATGG